MTYFIFFTSSKSCVFYGLTDPCHWACLDFYCLYSIFIKENNCFHWLLCSSSLQLCDSTSQRRQSVQSPEWPFARRKHVLLSEKCVPPSLPPSVWSTLWSCLRGQQRVWSHRSGVCGIPSASQGPGSKLALSGWERLPSTGTSRREGVFRVELVVQRCAPRETVFTLSHVSCQWRGGAVLSYGRAECWTSLPSSPSWRIWTLYMLEKVILYILISFYTLIHNHIGVYKKKNLGNYSVLQEWTMKFYLNTR